MSERRTTWDAARRLIASLKEAQIPYRSEIEQIVAHSSELLKPLSEPLLVDSHLTTMLAKSREEAYSDWLAWTFEQLGEVEHTLRVLGIVAASVPLPRRAMVEARREYYVPSGREGSSGRLDIRLLIQGMPVADLEIKLVDADQAVTDKQSGYADWGKGRPAVLIATDGMKDEYEGGFKLRTWGQVCAALRHEVRTWVTHGGNVLSGSLMLLFAAAIEENLLEIPAALLRGMCNRKGSPILSSGGREVETIRNWISLEEGNGGRNE